MLDHDPLWYKDAIIYELHVRAFHDSVGDGIGDFRGLTQKLDYLQDLGVTAIWLLPFYPSPLKDDGYDIADYTSIHNQYGSLRDFQEFLQAAHERGLRVITELVINHTSDQHPWFQRARRAAPGSPERDYYVWSDTPDRYKEARIIFQDFEPSNWSWDPLAKAYYWHRFYSHQPDLNFDNPEVWNAIFPVLDFWLRMGVDGMRLDAVPYLYEREGTNCENLPETHRFLKELRKHMDRQFTGRMFLAEANQWPEDAVAYFGDGDEAHMAFHFPVMPRLFMAIHMEDRYPVLDIMAQTPAIAETCQWVMFLRNHDELTLEMVTDEERDYMYRAYADDPQARINLGIRRRLAPLLGNNRRRIELMNGLLFSLPGTPVIYYGDEIGMGDNIYLGDRNGVRTPMQWSADRNAGFSRANPQKLYLPTIIDPEYHYEAVNVEAQQTNPNSLLRWMKRLIALRKRHRSFGRGSLEFLHPSNRKVLAFLRRWQDETILVVANLSRFVQFAELDLSEFQGQMPIELFSRNPFPPIGKLPYLLTFGPHAFYWFSLEAPRARTRMRQAEPRAATIPTIEVQHGVDELFRSLARERLEQVLPAYFNDSLRIADRWRAVKAVVLQESMPLRYDDTIAHVNLMEAEFDNGPRETFLLPLTHIGPAEAPSHEEDAPAAVVARLDGGDVQGILLDSLADPKFCRALLEAVAQGKRYFVAAGELVASNFAPVENGALDQDPMVTQGERGNAAITYDRRYVLKVFRRVEEDLNPDLEICRFLGEKTGFPNIAPVVGAIEYHRRRNRKMTLAILHEFVPSEGNLWQLALDELSRFYERVLSLEEDRRRVPPDSPALCHLPQERPEEVSNLLEVFFAGARLLGTRTAELHLALASHAEDPAFAPEPFSTLYQRSLYQSMRNQARRSLEELRQFLDELSERDREEARKVLEREEEILRLFHTLSTRRIGVVRTRYHGDFNLGNVLSTGRDYLFLNFEGDPSRSIADRRIKRSPLRDVVTMIRSLHYAAYSGLLGFGTVRGSSPGLIRPEEIATLEPWARFWFGWVAAEFLGAYLQKAGKTPILPGTQEELKVLIDCFLLEKALQELEHEIAHRPDWTIIPLKGILAILPR